MREKAFWCQPGVSVAKAEDIADNGHDGQGLRIQPPPTEPNLGCAALQPHHLREAPWIEKMKNKKIKRWSTCSGHQKESKNKQYLNEGWRKVERERV